MVLQRVKPHCNMCDFLSQELSLASTRMEGQQGNGDMTGKNILLKYPLFKSSVMVYDTLYPNYKLSFKRVKGSLLTLF